MEVEEILLNEEEFCVSLFDLLLNLLLTYISSNIYLLLIYILENTD